MPSLSVIDSLRRRWKRSVPSDVLKASSVLNLGEGKQIVVTYTSTADKMKIFSAFIREGLENGDLVDYTYPDEESETVRAKLKEYGIDVEKYEREGSLSLSSLTENFMPDGKFDVDRSVKEGLQWWAEAKRRGYNHVRDIEDVGDFSFVNGQWQKWIAEYWLDPRWDDPNVSEWVVSKEPVGVVYDSFIIDIIAINVEHMTETQRNELLQAFGGLTILSRRFFIDLLEDVDSFSRLVGLDHRWLLGQKILLEFDPVSNYEKIVDRIAKESTANVEPIFVFTSSTGPLHKYLVKHPTIKFFLTSISTSIPETISKNKVVLPAKNVPLILDAISKVLETYGDANVCFVFDILSELLISIGPEKPFTFLHHALDMLSSRKTTSLFLLNSNAHEPQVVSHLRNFFNNQLTYNKNELKIVKTS